ncbi:MAG: hypothetical protein ACHQ1D_13325, partial [Nitrososphaerales archaeon]
PIQFKLRWDKGNLANYYHLTHESLANGSANCVQLNCAGNCVSANHKTIINCNYKSIVEALRFSEHSTIPRIPHTALKPFWNAKLDDLKSKSILWHNIWVDSGKPSTGLVYRIKTSCKLNYKLAIKNAFFEYENSLKDDLFDNLLKKDSESFWKCWSSKLRHTTPKGITVNGSSDDKIIADAFAQHFQSVYCNSFDNAHAKSEFHNLFDTLEDTNPIDDLVTVQLVDSCIHKLKQGKASGLDDIYAEHLLNAHPILVVLLCRLFRDMLVHGYVPDDFGKGVIIPILKEKLGDSNDVSNYRGITLIPVISKLFELVLLDICMPFLGSDDLQFGFKKGLGCSNAIFLFQETIEYFLSRGSSIFVAALDFQKAFDRTNFFKLFTSLIKSGLPRSVIN